MKWEYTEDKINLNEPHISGKRIIQMREQAGWIHISTVFKGDTAMLKFKRKIQIENGKDKEVSHR